LSDMRQISDILEIARTTIRQEASALEALADSLNEGSDFRPCVEAVVASSGRLVLTGIGKSAIIAQKVAATLNSTGQPALFLHAADAIHGDLGMIRPDDMVVCLSKSGETPEIRVLLPLLRNFGNPIIAITANRTSSLALAARYVLWTPVELEADPNNLAPTTSTTAQMAMGDALAVALLSLRGFTPADFAKFHPGGSLGKQLYLRVRDLVARNERPRVTESSGLQEIIIEISSKRLGMTAVTGTDGALRGIITDGDLRRMLQQRSDFSGVSAADIMTPDPKTIDPEALAVEALATMRQHSITQLLVADSRGYQGVVHLHDLIREGLV
jgi:arabinose-5-phosphate isomerase